jgi:pyruvate oxidase
MNISEAILQVLADYGVERIYGIPGDAINHLIEAIRKQDKIKFIQVRHEETGAFAASAHAKLTGKLGVCIGTAGPGAIHLLNGLYDAKSDHAPVLAITGQSETQYIGTNYHQEVDLEMLYKDVTVFNQTIINPAQMPQLAIRACQTALARNGVAHISIPNDIAALEVPQYEKNHYTFISRTHLIPAQEYLEKAASLLNEAKKIVILAGIGTKNAKEELLQTARILQAPIIRSLRAKDVLPDEHPLSLGGLGLLGTRPAANAINSCDLIFMIGTDFPYPEFYPPAKTPSIQIDIDAYQIGKRYPVTVGLTGHADVTLQKLLPLLNPKNDDSYLTGLQQEMKDWLDHQSGIEISAEEPIHPQILASMAGKLANNDAIFLCDTGAVTVWAARHLHIRNEQRFTLSAMLASMAFGMPAAIGAQLEFPNRQVIALCGDGGFHMLMGDFITAVKYKLPIKIIIFNNHKLGLIQMEQEVIGNPQYQVELLNPDYALFAKLCGGDGITISHACDLSDALIKAYSSDLPFIVNVEINPEELTRPPHINLKMASGYAKAKIKEALGKGDRKKK